MDFYSLRKKRFGFSFRGLVILLLVLLPNVLFYLYVSKDLSRSGQMMDRYPVISAIERGSQLLLMLALVFRVHAGEPSLKSKYVLGMGVFLLLYYALWTRYFAGGGDYGLISGSFPVYMGMAVFPSTYFALAGKWRKDRLGFALAILFGLSHTLNTYLNFGF
ncbi:hypothetical protein [Paenibacillus motobuensis]|uniref:Uncharacterized protein n=1 Tax=Paenibacillus motobuensis TaxID=295324 RepID=A0ABP3I445_9BACL